MATLQLQVVTPDKTVVNEEVETVICPGLLGEFGIMPNHAPLLAALKIGRLIYRTKGQDHHLFIGGGFADVHKNICSVLAESAEAAEDIDEARAEAAKKRAQERLSQKSNDLDEVRAEIALERAVMRLHIAQMQKLK